VSSVIDTDEVLPVEQKVRLALEGAVREHVLGIDHCARYITIKGPLRDPELEGVLIFKATYLSGSGNLTKLDVLLDDVTLEAAASFMHVAMFGGWN
jgi:hypothetical protein